MMHTAMLQHVSLAHISQAFALSAQHHGAFGADSALGASHYEGLTHFENSVVHRLGNQVLSLKPWQCLYFSS